MKTDDFNYDLDESLIAQVPIENRDESKLMILDKNKSNLNTRINLQMKFRDNSNKLNIQKHKGKTNILKEVYNNEDF